MALTAPGATQTPTVGERVTETLTNATKILRAYRLTDIADLAERKASEAVTARSVVVVGEVKRGKSALVNALLGVRDASPVDVDAATSASLHFVGESRELRAGQVELVFPGSVTRVPLAQLPDWVTLTGARVTDARTDSLPTRAIVAVRKPRLADTVVIDTPGVGGLDATHAQLAMSSSTDNACVLLVVCDATTPLTAPEMALIRDAAASIESIVVAVTKTDKNLRRWRPIVEDNKRLIREHLGRDLPVVGVSSIRALAATDLRNPKEAAALEHASGITALRQIISDGLALGDHQNQINGLRTALEGLRKVDAQIDNDIAITTKTDKMLPELTARRDQLRELKDHSGQWELHLGRDLTFARQEALHHLDVQLEELRNKWNTRINKSGMAVLRKNAQVFTQEMETDLLAALTSAVTSFLGGLGQLVDALFSSEVIREEIRQSVLSSMREPDRLNGAEVAGKRENLFDPSILTMGMVGTSMLGAVVGVGAIAGVVWIGVNLAYRAMRQGKQNLLTWLRETLMLTRTAAGRMLEVSMAAARTEIVLRYRDHLRHEIEATQKQLAEAEKAARQDAATKEKTLERLHKNKTVVATRVKEIEELIASLTSGAAR